MFTRLPWQQVDQSTTECVNCACAPTAKFQSPFFVLLFWNFKMSAWFASHSEQDIAKQIYNKWTKNAFSILFFPCLKKTWEFALPNKANVCHCCWFFWKKIYLSRTRWIWQESLQKLDNPQDSVTDARMYKQPGSALCLVRCFEFIFRSWIQP